jgi:hypothetical protein
MPLLIVVDDRLCGVGRRGDGADHAEGRALDHGEPVIAGVGDGAEDLGARRLQRAQRVLADLVVDAAEAGLVVRVLRQLLHVAHGHVAHRLHDLVAQLQAAALVLLVGAARRLHRAVDVGVDAVLAPRHARLAPPCLRRQRLDTDVGCLRELRRRALDGVGGRGGQVAAEPRDDALDDLLDAPLVDR